MKRTDSAMILSNNAPWPEYRVGVESAGDSVVSDGLRTDGLHRSLTADRYGYRVQSDAQLRMG